MLCGIRDSTSLKSCLLRQVIIEDAACLTSKICFGDGLFADYLSTKIQRLLHLVAQDNRLALSLAISILIGNRHDLELTCSWLQQFLSPSLVSPSPTQYPRQFQIQAINQFLCLLIGDDDLLKKRKEEEEQNVLCTVGNNLGGPQ